MAWKSVGDCIAQVEATWTLLQALVRVLVLFELVLPYSSSLPVEASPVAFAFHPHRKRWWVILAPAARDHPPNSISQMAS
jgi:hypothetical protein